MVNYTVSDHVTNLVRGANRKIKLTGNPGFTPAIHGVEGGADGDCIVILNVMSVANVQIVSQSTDCAATNRFSIGKTYFGVGSTMMFFYSSDIGMWCPFTSF
jgi:hypothetical protein